MLFWVGILQNSIVQHLSFIQQLLPIGLQKVGTLVRPTYPYCTQTFGLIKPVMQSVKAL